MGRPAPPFDLTVIDETGTRLPPGVEGNVALRTAGGRAPGLFLGYRGDPVRTEAVFQDGWYLTGDRAYVDEEGYFWRSEEHTSELQSLMRISYAVFCLKKKKTNTAQMTANKYT